MSSCSLLDTLSSDAAATAGATSPPSTLPLVKLSKTTAITTVRASERQSVIAKRKQPTLSQPKIGDPSISQLDGLSETPNSLTVSFPGCSPMADFTGSSYMHHPLHTSSPTQFLAKKAPALDSAPESAPVSAPEPVPASASSHADAVMLQPTPPLLRAPPPPPLMSRYFPREWWKVLCSECWRASHSIQYHHCETCHRKIWG